MKAKLITGQAPGGARHRLVDNLPLSTPYVLQFFPIYACNFTCKYCHHSIEKNKRGFVTDKVIMDYELFKKCVDEMTAFPEKIKTLRFVGMGEPLLHKDIAKMVKYASEKNIANRIEILTNGSLLTHEMSDALIEAGLDRMVISLQGITAEKYKEVSNIDLDFDKFVDNIRYLYEHKTKLDLYCKIVDCALETEEDRKKYFDIFGDICDSIGIENTVPIFPNVEFNEELMKGQKTQFGLPVVNCDICPQPFFTMQINPDGKVVGCYSIAYPAILGDCNDQTVTEIWNGELYQDFRYKMLHGLKCASQVCAECNIMNFRLFPEDDISSDVERLKPIYEVK